VAALHSQGGVVRVVVVGIDDGETTLKTAETLHPGAGPGGLATLAEKVGGIDLVIRVLPPAFTVARVVALPDAGEGETSNESTADALALMGETDLPSAIPAFRRAAGLINPGRGAGRKAVGLLTAWPETSQLDAAGRMGRIAPEVAISEVAAVAMLGQLSGGVERAWTVDRLTGAMTVLAVGPEKTVVRVARVPAGDAGMDMRRSVIAETSKAAGLLPSPASTGTAWLEMDPSPASARILGQVRSSEWVQDYGLAAAAAVAFADANPAVNGLVGLHEIEPKAKPPVLQRISEWLGSPVRAAAIIGICVLAAICIPIGVSMAKVKLLEKAITNEGELRARNAQDDKDVRFARLLREKRWPMLKLMADVAGACPEGINIDAVELTQGDGVSVRGIADDTDKLSTFRERLGQTKVFSDIAMPMTNPKPEGVQFQLSAKVPAGAATYAVKPADDWAAKTLFERIYHEPPKGAAHTTASRPERTDRTDRTSRADRGDRTNNNGNNNSRSDRTTTPAAKPAEKVVIPPALSDAAIAKLSRDDAMKEWTNRKKVAGQPGVDEATKKRLMEESDKAKARMLSLSGGGA
jgi:hypothetical protein